MTVGDAQAKTQLLEVFETLCTIMVVEIFYQYASGQLLPFVSQDVDYFVAWVRRRIKEETPYILEAKKLCSTERQHKLTEILRTAERYAEVRVAQQIYDCQRIYHRVNR